MTLEHGTDFSLVINHNSWISDYATVGNQTTLVILAPTAGELFTSSGNFEIADMIIANSYNEISALLVKDFTLSNAYPNPFNPSTTIGLIIPEAGQVSVMVYNLSGQLIAELANTYLGADHYQFTWNAENASSGMYLLRAEYAGQISAQKLMLLK